MLYWLLLFLASLLLFVLVRVFILSYASFLMKVMVQHHHEDGEAILSTGLVPERWVVSRGRRPRMKRTFTKRMALRKLRKLIAYFARTNLVSGPDERDHKVAKLKSVYAAWQSSCLRDLLPPQLEDSLR